MKNIKKLAALVAVLSALFLSGCNTIEEQRILSEHSQKNLRFREVERFLFPDHLSNGHCDAIVYLDTLTGVKYLYIWQGYGNGGPAITRLWDK